MRVKDVKVAYIQWSECCAMLCSVRCPSNWVELNKLNWTLKWTLKWMLHNGVSTALCALQSPIPSLCTASKCRLVGSRRRYDYIYSQYSTRELPFVKWSDQWATDHCTYRSSEHGWVVGVVRARRALERAATREARVSAAAQAPAAQPAHDASAERGHLKGRGGVRTAICG